jgi:hypothetical protein
MAFGLGTILSLLALLAGTGSSIAASEQQDEAEGKAQAFKDKTAAAKKEAFEKAKKEKRRKALAKAIGAEDLSFTREVEAPEEPDLTMSNVPQIISGISQGVGGLGSFLTNLNTTASRSQPEQKRPEFEQIDINKLFPEEEKDPNKLFPGSDITTLG